MHDEGELHVMPWRRGQRRHVYGRWPIVMGWICLLLPALSSSALLSESAGLTLVVWVFFAIPLVGLFTGILMVASTIILVQGGIYLLKRKARARGLLISYSWVMLAIQGPTIFCLLAQGDSCVIVGDGVGAPVAWVLIPSILSVIWPAFLLLWLNLPGTKEEMGAWPGGPNFGKPPRPKGEATQTIDPAPRPAQARPSEWWKQWDG